jgi:hypothetical protein
MAPGGKEFKKWTHSTAPKATASLYRRRAVIQRRRGFWHRAIFQVISDDGGVDVS